MEKWKQIADYPMFEVSDKGNIRRTGTTANLKQFKTKEGYMLLATKPYGRKGRNKTFRVHREVAKAFLANLENKPAVNHKDGDKANNVLTNLEWVTHSENMRHAFSELGRTVKKGDENPLSKITMQQAYDAYNNKRLLGISIREQANNLGVAHSTIVRCNKKGAPKCPERSQGKL